MKTSILNPKGLLIMAAAFAIGVTSCKKEPTVPSVPSLEILVDGVVKSNITLESKIEGEEFTIVIKATRNWSVTNVPTWITVSPTNGQADRETTVKIAVDENTGDPRDVGLVFSIAGGSVKETVSVSQSGFVANPMTVKELRALHTGSTVTITEDKTVVATIISNANETVGGNSVSKKNIVVQDDEAGIMIRLKDDPEPAFVVGQEVYISTKDLELAMSYGVLQLNNVPATAIKRGSTRTFTAKSITPAQLLSGAYESMYVAVSDVQFTIDAVGKKINDNEFTKNNTAGHAPVPMVSKDDDDIQVFVSKYAAFFKEPITIPNGSGVMKGIAGFSNNVYQIQPQTAADFDGLTEARFAEAPTFGVSSETISVSATGGDAKVSVKGNVAWTASVTAGGTNITSGPTPASGTGAGDIVLVFPENTDTDNAKEVTLTVTTTADVTTKTFVVVFTQAKASSPGEPSLLFAGADFEVWTTFKAGLSGSQNNISHNATGGIDGSGALAITETNTNNVYAFTAKVTDPAPNVTSKITFRMKGTSPGKSLSMNLHRANGTNYNCFNLGDCTGDMTLEPTALQTSGPSIGNGTNSYAGSINTGGNWVTITLNVGSIASDINITPGGNLFSMKIGKDSDYNLLIDDVIYE